MFLKDMPTHATNYGTFQRADKEQFTVTAILYESPDSYDYWLAKVAATHKNWGALYFTLTIPKKIANSVALANALIGVGPLEQVKSVLLRATKEGRPLEPCFAVAGWVLA